MESKVTRRQSHALLIEVLDEALRLLPPTVPTFTKLKIYDEPIPNIRRTKRVDAHGLKTRRSKAFNSKP
jgi:valyl-tRNA synthetase